MSTPDVRRVCSIASSSGLGAEQPTGRRRMGRMHGVREQERLLRRPRNSGLLMARDESLPASLRRAARDDVGLWYARPRHATVRSVRAAFEDKAELLLDPGADLPRRPRQACGDLSLQAVSAWRSSRAPPMSKLVRPSIRCCSRSYANRGSCRRQARRLGDVPAAPPVIQKHRRVCASRDPTGRRPIARQSNQLVAILSPRTAWFESWLHRNPPSNQMQGISPPLQ